MRNRLTGILIFRYIIHSLSLLVFSLLETIVTISWRDQCREMISTAYLQFKADGVMLHRLRCAERRICLLNSETEREIPAIFFYKEKIDLKKIKNKFFFLPLFFYN